MEKGKGKGGQKWEKNCREGREEWGRRGKGASWLCGMDAPRIRISNKKPKIFGRFATNRGRVYGGEG